MTACTPPARGRSPLPPNEATDTRTSRSSITFSAPFRLVGLQQPQAAGTYKVDTYEESRGEQPPVYRLVATHLHLRVGGSIRIRAVDRGELQAAWEQDDPLPWPATNLVVRTFLPTEGSCT